MKRMTPAANLLLRILTGKYKHFARKGMLAANGSFYCHDEYLMQELYISDNTIKRARIFLKKAGEIDYVIGKYKGAPTQYWIISKGAKKEPFEQHTEGAKMSAEGANLVVKGSQNGTLYNKEAIKMIIRICRIFLFLPSKIKRGLGLLLSLMVLMKQAISWRVKAAIRY